MGFIIYCNTHELLLAVFPPHSTHTLQLLDVVIFRPLSAAYSKQLSLCFYKSQSFLHIKKGSYFAWF
jgi:hypothetical protein